MFSCFLSSGRMVLAALLLPAIFSSCLTIKNYDPSKPFVYKTEVQIEGEMAKDEKNAMAGRLNDQLHDSLRNQVKTKLFLWKTLNRPRIYDSVNAERSLPYMSNMMKSLGYYRDSIFYKSRTEIKGDQQRVIVSFIVLPGKLFVLDSIRYNLSDSSFQSRATDTIHQLVMATTSERLLKKGHAFSSGSIAAELERIASLCRNNGYLKFNAQQLIAHWDTLGSELLAPDITPLEQLEMEQQRMESPTADVEISFHTDRDSSRLVRFYVGRIKVYPDLGIDTTGTAPRVTSFSHLNTEVISFHNRFRPQKLLPFIHLSHGEMYQQRNYLRTLNRFNKLGTWKSVNIVQLPRPGEDTVDFELRMVPSDRYRLRFGVDVSHNLSSNVSEGSLIGFGLNFILTDRSLAKGPNQSVTHLRYGFEMSPSLDSVQSKQLLVNYTISFPRMIPRFIRFRNIPYDEVSTFLSSSASSTNRIDYYNIKTVIFSWGSRFNWKNKDIGFRFPNIEFNYLDRKAGLEQLIRENASYKFIFNDGFISSIIAKTTFTWNKKAASRTLKLGTEEAGFFTGLFHSIIPNAKLYRFLKFDLEFIEEYKIRRTSFAWRFFGGAGYGIPFSNTGGKADSLNYYMPFFRQYYVGGSSSMRAWPVRKLGPGSALKSYSQDVAPDRYGDMQLELNMEYRFLITKVLRYPIDGAIFTDAGNIWYIRKNNDFVNGEINFNRFWKDIAIGVGTGVRADLSFIMVRLDYSYKAKNPSPDIMDTSLQNRWFANWEPFGGQVQLAFSYPF